MNALDLMWTAIFLVLGGWFFVRNRKVLTRSTTVRHIVFITFVWAGVIALLHGNEIVRWVFGREIHKGDKEEFVAGLIPLGSVVLAFAAAAIALGTDRVRQFKLYGETFPVSKLTRRK